jgi:hypothetical protein
MSLNTWHRRVGFGLHAEDTENNEHRIERENIGDADGKTQDDA